MRARRAPSVAALVLAAVLVVGGVAVSLPTERTLVVADAETGERLLATPVAEGSTVALAYIHSVERTPVRDGYAVWGDELEMTRMAFESYGWGLPADADVERVNGSFAFDPPGSCEELYVSPGARAGHVLVVDGRSFDLVALSGGDSVRLTVERRSAVAALGGDRG